MSEKSHKRNMRSDPSNSQSDIEVASSSNEGNLHLSEQDMEDVSNKIENKISKRLRLAEFGQRKILRLIENLSSRVDNLSSTSSEKGGCSNSNIRIPNCHSGNTFNIEGFWL